MFIGSAVLGGFALRLQIVESTVYPKAFLSDLAFISLFASVGFLIKRRRRSIYYIVLSVVYCLLLVLDTIYFRSHGSILSVFLAPQIEFLPQVADAAVSLLHWSDSVYLLNAAALVVGIVLLRRRGYFDRVVESRRSRRRKATTCLVVALLVFGAFGLFMTKTEQSRITKHWNRPYLVEHFGVYTYHLSDIIKFACAYPGGSEIEAEDFAAVVGFFGERDGRPPSTNAYTGILAGQNIIVIHAESVEGMFLHRSMGGREITPNLNRLAREGLYFDNFYTQQSSGTSSDSEFTFNTSLYPINNGTVFISHFGNTFASMPKNLKHKGYATLAMHGNHGDFWNREIMNKTLGYDDNLSKKDFAIDDVIGMGLSDVSFFRQAAEMLAHTAQPFYATLIMLTNHTPFAEVDKYGEFDVGQFEGKRFGNYMKALHYSDRAIGHLIDDLRRRGLLDNTTVVVYGDHPANLDRDKIKRFLGLDTLDSYDLRRVERMPFIIWSPAIETPRVISKPMGMIDVMPTLGNMLGVNNRFAFGNDIFSVAENRVAFPDGSWLDENVVFDSSKMKFKVFGREMIEGYRDAQRAEIEAALYSGAESEVDSGLSVADVCSEISKKRVFRYRPGRPHKKGLGRYAYRHVYQTTVEVARHLEISDLILEHDLLHPRDGQHRRSIAFLK